MGTCQEGTMGTIIKNRVCKSKFYRREMGKMGANWGTNGYRYFLYFDLFALVLTVPLLLFMLLHALLYHSVLSLP